MFLISLPRLDAAWGWEPGLHTPFLRKTYHLEFFKNPHHWLLPSTHHLTKRGAPLSADFRAVDHR